MNEAQIFPLDERYLIDMKFMVMYPENDPKQWHAIFRSAHNTRVSSASLRAQGLFSSKSKPEPISDGKGKGDGLVDRPRN